MSGWAVLFLRARDPEGGLDPGLTFTSIRTINAQPMFTTFQLIVHTYILLRWIQYYSFQSTSKIPILRRFLPLDLVVSARKVAPVGEGGLSAEFAELHFSVSHRNSGGGVCGQLRIMLLALAITRCPCARGLPLPRLRCNTFYIRFISSNYVARKPSELWRNDKFQVDLRY